MARSIANIMSQIERLQREAAAIQTEVVGRIRKDIEKYGLTPEQLFGKAAPGAKGSGKGGTKAAAKSSKSEKPAKYADGAGHTWGGMGPRPAWLRQALEQGKALEDFLIGAVNAATSGNAAPKAKATAKAAPKAAPKTKRAAPAKKKVSAKTAAEPKAAAKKGAGSKKGAAPKKKAAAAKRAPARKAAPAAAPEETPAG